MGDVIYGHDFKAKAEKEPKPETENPIKPDVTYEGSYAWREEQAKFTPTPFVAPETDPA